MKKFLFITFSLLLACVAWSQDDSNDIVKVGDSMPAFTIVHDDGTQLTSSSLKGKVILVNLFATWCPPCQKELAAVKDQLWPKYKDNKDFVLLVIGRELTDEANGVAEQERDILYDDISDRGVKRCEQLIFGEDVALCQHIHKGALSHVCVTN